MDLSPLSPPFISSAANPTAARPGFAMRPHGSGSSRRSALVVDRTRNRLCEGGEINGPVPFISPLYLPRVKIRRGADKRGRQTGQTNGADKRDRQTGQVQ